MGTPNHTGRSRPAPTLPQSVPASGLGPTLAPCAVSLTRAAMTADRTDERLCEFSFDLRLEISRALGAWLEQGERARERLHRATQRVCTEAHALRLSPDQVVAALGDLFERTPVAGGGDLERRRAAWQEFTQSCISAYYNAGDPE